MKLSFIIKSIFFLSLFLLVDTSLMAQIDTGSGGAPWDPDVVDAIIPIDGGILTVTLMAVAYGVKRHRDNENSED